MVTPKPLSAAALLLAVSLGVTTPAEAAWPTSSAGGKLPAGKVEIDVKDLHCKTCAKKVARKLYAVPGVKRVQSNLKKDLVVVTLSRGRSAEPVILWTAVDAGGVEPVRLRHADRSLDADAMAPLLAEAGVELSSTGDRPDH